eukprot:8723887-Pyramimonas_sp.AAC.1
MCIRDSLLLLLPSPFVLSNPMGIKQPLLQLIILIFIIVLFLPHASYLSSSPVSSSHFSYLPPLPPPP